MGCCVPGPWGSNIFLICRRKAFHLWRLCVQHLEQEPAEVSYPNLSFETHEFLVINVDAKTIPIMCYLPLGSLGSKLLPSVTLKLYLVWGYFSSILLMVLLKIHWNHLYKPFYGDREKNPTWLSVEFLHWGVKTPLWCMYKLVNIFLWELRQNSPACIHHRARRVSLDFSNLQALSHGH